MTKNDFIFTFLANQMSPFTNTAALGQNIKDLIGLAERIYLEAQSQLEIKDSVIEPSIKKRQGK